MRLRQLVVEVYCMPLMMCSLLCGKYLLPFSSCLGLCCKFKCSSQKEGSDKRFLPQTYHSFHFQWLSVSLDQTNIYLDDDMHYYSTPLLGLFMNYKQEFRPSLRQFQLVLLVIQHQIIHRHACFILRTWTLLHFYTTPASIPYSPSPNINT